MFQLRNQHRVPGAGYRDIYSRIERADHDGLLSAAREARDGEAVAIHARVAIEVIETAPHRQENPR
jgi:hypothetical protein